MFFADLTRPALMVVIGFIKVRRLHVVRGFLGPGWWLAIVVSCAALSAACKSGVSETAPSPLPEPSPTSTVSYTALGASDAIGVGSSVVCVPFEECPNGKGYVYLTTKDLRSRGYLVNQVNLGIPSAVLSRSFQDLGQQFGRTILFNLTENEAPFVASGSMFVTIFTGANDVNVITGALGAGLGASDQTGFINTQVTTFGDDLRTLIRIVRDRAPEARMVILNLPNMGAMPFLSSASLQQRQAAQMASVSISRSAINPLTAQGILVVDLLCDARSYQASTYSADGFHPSDTGYAWMAGEVIAAATSSYHAPSANCAQMALVPPQ